MRKGGFRSAFGHGADMMARTPARWRGSAPSAGRPPAHHAPQRCGKTGTTRALVTFMQGTFTPVFILSEKFRAPGRQAQFPSRAMHFSWPRCFREGKWGGGGGTPPWTAMALVAYPPGSRRYVHRCVAGDSSAAGTCWADAMVRDLVLGGWRGKSLLAAGNTLCHCVWIFEEACPCIGSGAAQGRTMRPP